MIAIPGDTSSDRDTRRYWLSSRYQEVLVVIEIPGSTGGDRDTWRYWW